MLRLESKVRKIDGEHLNGMNEYDEIYVRKFMQLIGKVIYDSIIPNALIN